MPGRVRISNCISQAMASTRVLAHISAFGSKDTHTFGRSAWPNRRQRSCSSNCTQRTPAAFPAGMPGMGVEMDGAVQQAPQPGRQSMLAC